ncbi:hypothetical protein MACK_001603 [Theileria orientalis]|uniref:Uncharacterized protein n=1 Tax=Theileria orientalis TaxID=68886 RepID=A0A976QVR4_THEOR|nr:hypothetical protein MACK_001603 [Theileria orientalis]
MVIFYDRSAQILLLKEEFPKLRSWGFRPTVFGIPISCFFGRSKCVLEMTIPREYPAQKVSFKLLNPIPHKWAQGNIIRCPNELYEKPLVDIVWEVVSNFEDYEKYVSGKRFHEDDTGSQEKYVEAFTKLKQDIVHGLNNSPQEAIAHVNSLGEERVKEALQSDTEIYRLIYKCESISDVVNETKMRLDENEKTVSNYLRNIRKKKNLFTDIFDSLDYIKKFYNEYGLDFKSNSKKTVRKALKKDIADLEEKIKLKKESLVGGKRKYEQVKDELYNCYNNLNLLYALNIALKSSS